MKVLICLLTVYFIACCKYQNEESSNFECQDVIKDFIRTTKNTDLTSLMGFTIESRGRDINGDRFLRMAYTNRDRIIISLPSLQRTETNYYSDLENYDYTTYAHEFGVDSTQAKEFTKLRIVKIVDIFQRLDVMRVHSQLHLGEFVEFALTPNCSVWHMKDSSYLNETYQALFDSAILIERNWFILVNPISKPVLKEFPSNMEINK